MFFHIHQGNWEHPISCHNQFKKEIWRSPKIIASHASDESDQSSFCEIMCKNIVEWVE